VGSLMDTKKRKMTRQDGGGGSRPADTIAATPNIPGIMLPYRPTYCHRYMRVFMYFNTTSHLSCSQAYEYGDEGEARRMEDEMVMGYFKQGR
jgi:hypothetical protein